MMIMSIMRQNWSTASREASQTPSSRPFADWPRDSSSCGRLLKLGLRRFGTEVTRGNYKNIQKPQKRALRMVGFVIQPQCNDLNNTKLFWCLFCTLITWKWFPVPIDMSSTNCKGSFKLVWCWLRLHQVLWCERCTGASQKHQEGCLYDDSMTTLTTGHFPGS